MFICSLICLVFVTFASFANSQTLVASYPFPQNSMYNSFWGLTSRNDTLWIASDNNGKLYKSSWTAIIMDSLATPFNYNHGLVWDGSGFWLAEQVRTAGARIYKINTAGVRVDSILTGSYAQGLGGIALDGQSLWFAVYYPDNTTYPFAFAYKMNLNTRQLVDTIPLRGRQVQGIAVKGDTVFYVNDNFQSEQERIYAFRKAVGDTIFSWRAPDPDNDCDPRGLYWDGQHLWLIAYRVGGSTFRTLYKYEISGQGSPTITTSVNSIDFGNVVIGNTANQNLIVTNVGTANLIITSLVMTNPRFSISPNNTPDTIPPNQTRNYTVSFTPTVYDTTSGELRITSNDAGTPVKVVALRGKGVYSGAWINLSANSFNYGARRINSLCGFSFNVTNQGSQPLQINSVAFGGNRFRFDTLNANFPIVIDTQKTRTLRIWFNPNSAVTFSDSAIFNTNAVNNASAKILLSGTGENNPTTLGDILWEGHIPDNPNTTFQDYQPKSMKMISDVNSDGVADMIVATENYWTICYNGNASVTADTLWKFNTHFGTINTGSVDWEDAMQIMDDVNNDGVPEVVIGCGGGNEMVYCLSGVTGAKLWQYGSPTTTSDGDIFGLRTDKDFNGDGRKDVLISASGEANFTGRHSVICVNGLNGQEIFNVVQPYNFTYDVVSTSSGGAIGAGNNGGPYLVRGFNNSGQNTWNYSITGTLNSVWSLKQVPDINNDGQTDIIGLQGFSGGIFALSGTNGSVIYTNTLGSSNNGTIELLDDANGNGAIDFTLSAPQVAYRIDSRTNTILWQRPLASSFIRDADMLGDITGDSISDVLFATQQPGKVFVLNGTDGAELFQYTFGTSISERADRVAKLIDIDNSGTNEFVAGSRDGRIKCFSGGPGVIGIEPISDIIPDRFALYQNYPNPFNPETVIRFSLPRPSQGGVWMARLVIYDLLGREVASLIPPPGGGQVGLLPGRYEIKWDASAFASGIYFYKLTAGDFADTRKMVVIR